MSLGYRSVVLNIIGKDNASKAFMTASRSAETAASRIDRSIARISARSAALQAVGQKMTKFITLPLLALGALAIKQAADFQKALNTIQVVTGQTDAQMARSAEGLKKIAVASATSLGPLTDAFYIVEKSGLRGAKALAVVNAAAKGAKAENADLGTVANALTSVMASYGKSIGTPTQAMNQLIVAAGLSKTTQQDFANSLSNVIPVASSLGISFADVGAAIATMTQHGETAQHATENIRNLMTNLAGQNNVAAQAMQQLDIPIANLRKNLGKRGLVGTLDMVLDHIAKYTKGGSVVVATFRHSASAAHDLDVMLNHMSGSLKDNSQAFRDGKMSYLDYRDFVRSLGAPTYNLGKQFMTLVQASGGFNKLLQAGQPNVQTVAGTLQKVLGGITGMNVALQVSGNSRKRLHDDLKLIADAGKSADGSIRGFAHTQATAAFKADQLKAKIQVLAVNIGDKLLPFALRIVKQFGKMVDWLTNLSPTTQKWIIKLGLLMAVLGPLLAIIGRIGRAVAVMLTIGVFVSRFVAGMLLVNVSTATYGNAAFQAGMRARIGFSQALTSVGMLARSMGALAIGLTTGYMARGASTGTKLMTGLGSAAVGAALGFSMGGGPWGAAIGGLIGGLSSLGASFIGSGNKADQASKTAIAALQAENAVANDLLSTLKSINGQYGKQARVTIANDLSKKGADGLTQFEKYSQYGVSPHTLVSAVLGNAPAMNRALAEIQKHLHKTYDDQQLALKLSNDLLALASHAGGAELRWEEYQKGLINTIVPIKQLSKGVKGLGKEVKNTGRDLFDASKLGDVQSAFGTRNTEVVKENIDHLKQIAVNAVKSGKSVSATFKTYKANLDKLFAGFRKLGFKKSELKDLFDTFGSLSHDLSARGKKLPDFLDKLQNIQISLKTKPLNDQLDKVSAKIDKLNKGMQLGTLTISDHKARNELGALYNQAFLIHEQIAAISNSVINIDVNVHRHGKIPPPHAAGGPVADGYFTVGERGYELGYKRGSRVEIFSNRDSRRMLGMSRVPGFAGGSKHVDNPEAFLHQKKHHDLLQGIVQAIASFLATAHNMHSSSADFRSAARSLMEAARQGKISTADLAAIIRANKRLDRLSANRDRVNRLLGTRQPPQTAYEALASARQGLHQARADYRGTITGSRDVARGLIDVSTIGQNSWGVASSSSIVTSLKAMAVKAKQFSRVLKRLIKMGLPRYIVEQLAQAGPVALAQAQAFAAASPSELRSIKSSYRAINDAGRSAGKAVARAYDTQSILSAQKSVERAHKTVERLLGRRKDLNAAIRARADDMIRELEKALGIKLSPSLSHHHDSDGGGEHHHHRRRGGDSGHDVNQTFNIYGITDPEAITRAVARRLARTVA